MFVKNPNLGADPNLEEITVLIIYKVHIGTKLTDYWYKTYGLLIQNLRTIGTKSLAWLNICVWTSALNTRLIKQIFFIIRQCRIFGKIFGFGKVYLAEYSDSANITIRHTVPTCYLGQLISCLKIVYYSKPYRKLLFFKQIFVYLNIKLSHSMNGSNVWGSLVPFGDVLSVQMEYL